MLAFSLSQRRSTMIGMTARIVSAFVRGNAVAVEELPDLIRTTYAALSTTAMPVQAPLADQPRPAVPIKKSVQPDAVICLECGKPQKMLKRHLATSHGLSVTNYRTKWSLPADYPVVAPSYAEHRSAMAIKIGLGRKKAVAPVDSVEEKPGHRYPASRWSKPSA